MHRVAYTLVGLAILSAAASALPLVGLLFERAEFDPAGVGERTSRSLGGFAAIGLDWFPADRIGIGGHVGVQGAAIHTSQEMAFPGGSPQTSDGHELGTLSSGVRVSLWF